jgi:hypothetical protein
LRRVDGTKRRASKLVGWHSRQQRGVQREQRSGAGCELFRGGGQRRHGLLVGGERRRELFVRHWRELVGQRQLVVGHGVLAGRREFVVGQREFVVGQRGLAGRRQFVVRGQQ